MKQESTQTVRLSLGLTRPEHNLIHSPSASIYHPYLCVVVQWSCISSCTGSKGRSCSHQQSAKPAETCACTQHYIYGLESSIIFMAHSLPANCIAQLSLSFNWGLPSPGTCSQNPGGISAHSDLSTPTEITWFPLALPQMQKAKHRPAILLPSSYKNPDCAALHRRLIGMLFWIPKRPYYFLLQGHLLDSTVKTSYHIL